MRNPAKSRPLSKNVKRLMAMAREAGGDTGMYSVARAFTGREEEFCRLQGEIFREAYRKGHDLESFSELFMTSQMATAFDHSFFRPDGENNGIPMMMGSPGDVVEVLYEIDRIVRDAAEGADPVKAVMEVERERGWACLSQPCTTPVGDGGGDYAYWLGYVYRCECLMHEESSRMVYGAFPEKVMRDVYLETGSPGEVGLSGALEVCSGLDRRFTEENLAAAKA